MRSTNKRSRSKPNRPKTLGNIVNRVFDSSGPEGKVRGTPQQIIEKYQVLARDAQLSNDRVAAENFQQHAEHYTRLLAQAQREMQAEQEARRQSQENHNRQGQDDRNQDRNQDRGPRQDNRRVEPRRHGDDSGYGNGISRDSGSQDSFSVLGTDTSADSDRLVETPESRTPEPSAAQPVPAPQTEAKPKPENRRKPRAPKADHRATSESETKPEPQAKADNQATPESETKPEPQAKSEPQTKAEPKPKPEPKAKSEAKPEADAEAKPKTRRYTRKPRDTDSGGAPKVDAKSSVAE